MFRGKVKSMVQLFLLSLKLTFSRRFLFYVLGTIVWPAIVILWNLFANEDQPLDATHVLNVVLAGPGTALVVFLCMQMVSFERENRTLEVIFCLPGATYKVWALKLVTIYIAVFVDMLLLSVIAYVFFGGFNIVVMAFHAMFPLFVFGAVALLLSLVFKSGNAAGMVSGLLLVAVFLSHGGWKRTRYFPFLNYLGAPQGTDPSEWFSLVLQNRILMAGVAAVLVFLSLRLIENRERLL